MEKFIAQASRILKVSNFFSPKFRKNVGKDLAQANIALNEEEYINATGFAAIVFFIFSFFIFYALNINIVQCIAFSALLGAVVFFLICKYPAYKKKKRAEEIEKDLGIALKTIASKIKAGTPFEKIFAQIAASNYGVLSEEFGKADAKIKSGALNACEALKKMADNVDSLLVKRACMQLCFAYGHGGKGGGIEKTSEEIIELQKIKIKEYAAKLNFFGLLFVTLSSTVPALFSAYLTIGSMFLDFTISPNEVILSYVLLFPAMGAGVLLYLKEKSPKLFRGG